MTHQDIYTKFMIEYDKANVTSSYPSLTEYEVATVLDKAYHALIAQKVTGNNIRRVALEQDLKSIEDISPLIKNTPVSDPSRITIENSIANNVESIELEDDHLYFLNCYLKYTMADTPMDGQVDRMVPVQLGSHQIASKFYSTAYNMPWIKTPLGYIEDNKLFVVYDPINKPEMDSNNKFDEPQLVYIKTPNKFVKELDKVPFSAHTEDISYFVVDDSESTTIKDKYKFECSDTMAEELISLAVAFALENVESQRLNSKLNMRGLEA